MGYGVTRFISPVDENLLCSICSAVLEDAVLTPCGHSFCLGCLDTWLARPACTSCPQCRSHVLPSQARPILAVRSLIGALEVYCDNHERGCRLALRLEGLQGHLALCGHSPVQCAGCSEIVNRDDLAEHHINCEAIAAVIEDDSSDEDDSRPSSASSCGDRVLHAEHRVTEVAQLACRVTTLELQLKRLKRDLAAADTKNKRLERELRRTREELQDKRSELLDGQVTDFSPDYDYGYTGPSVGRLSTFIASFLLRKPGYVDRNRIFNAINRCYDNYGRSRDQYEHDVHMLLATAYASNWFSESQKLNFHCMLQDLIRHRQLSFTSF